MHSSVELQLSHLKLITWTIILYVKSREVLIAKLSRRDLLRSGVVLSGSTVLRQTGLARVQKIFDAAWTERTRTAVAPRERLLFDFGWRFTFGNAADPSRDLNFGEGWNNFSKTIQFEFATAKFDDSKWRELNLPHDWAVELPFVWTMNCTRPGNHILPFATAPC